MRPWRPPFHASPAARKGPISSKRVSSQDPLLRKFGNFSLNSLNFHPNFSSQAPKFGNFQLTSPQIWKFSAHKPPNLAIFSLQPPKFGNFPLTSPPFQRQMSVRKPHTSEIRAAHPYLKKSWVPPRGGGYVNCRPSSYATANTRKALGKDFFEGKNRWGWNYFTCMDSFIWTWIHTTSKVRVT